MEGKERGHLIKVVVEGEHPHPSVTEQIFNISQFVKINHFSQNNMAETHSGPSSYGHSVVMFCQENSEVRAGNKHRGLGSNDYYTSVISVKNAPTVPKYLPFITHYDISQRW